MKKTTAKIRIIAQNETGFEEVEVNGYEVKFDGYNHDFILHKHYLYETDSDFKFWVVTHVETGTAIDPIGPNDTRDNAIKSVHAKLLTVTSKQFDKKVIVAKKKFNIQ